MLRFVGTCSGAIVLVASVACGNPESGLSEVPSRDLEVFSPGLDLVQDLSVLLDDADMGFRSEDLDGAGCSSSDECPAGERCNVIAHQCEPPDDTCVGLKHCPSGSCVRVWMCCSDLDCPAVDGGPGKCFFDGTCAGVDPCKGGCAQPKPYCAIVAGNPSCVWCIKDGNCSWGFECHCDESFSCAKADGGACGS